MRPLRKGASFLAVSGIVPRNVIRNIYGTVVASWNAFILSLLILTEPEQWTLTVGVNNVSAQFSTDYAVVLAYTTLAMIPALVFYFLRQRHIVSGLTAGAVK